MIKLIVNIAKKHQGHTLLEAIIAAAIFVIVSVALSGVWVMYGKSLSKSAEYLAANQLARGTTEGLVANGWDWLFDNRDLLKHGRTDLPEENFPVERVIRGREATILFNTTYEAWFNDDPDLAKRPQPYLPPSICQITVTVRWRSANGKEPVPGTDFNNQTTYSTWVYEKGI